MSHIKETHVATALIPLSVGLLAAFVAYGRWRLAPLHGLAAAAVTR